MRERERDGESKNSGERIEVIFREGNRIVERLSIKIYNIELIVCKQIDINFLPVHLIITETKI